MQKIKSSVPFNLIGLCTPSLIIALLLATVSGHGQSSIKVAFLADVHLQDLYGKLSDNDFATIKGVDGKPVLMRTMASQLASTRLFNENYFAFVAALNDIAVRDIKIVALPGDYTDDGQPIHLHGLKRLLDQYHSEYGIEFFITTGNHDPVGPYAQQAGKDDFLGKEGKRQPIFSDAALYVQQPDDHPPIITRDIAKMGYAEITTYLGGYGFLPCERNLYWATPFSTYDYTGYDFSKAVAAGALASRMYEVAPGFIVPDASYVVEPVAGLWLLAIDGNTYLPKDKNGNPKDPGNYKGASIGYNNVMTNKRHLLEWVRQVAAQANIHHKTLIAFSHYPMVEFNDNASAEIRQFMGKGKWQINRVPAAAVAQSFADAGLQVHFGGHMHINNTGLRTTASGNTLLNVQTPSLAAYVPAYKLLTIHPDKKLEIETITIDDVPGFDSLFEHYQTEYDHLKKTAAEGIWNREILQAKTYHAFTDFHLQELVRLRFIKDDWHQDFARYLRGRSGAELLVLGNTRDVLNCAAFTSDRTVTDAARKEADHQAKDRGLQLADFKNWNGSDLILDFYRIRSGRELALMDISRNRIQQYRLLCEVFATKNVDEADDIATDMKLFFTILNKFLHGAPADHFSFDMESGSIKKLEP